jgi:GNAT superfamily N-acetyltransferase
MLVRLANHEDYQSVYNIKTSVHIKHQELKNTYFKQTSNVLSKEMYEESIINKMLYVIENDLKDIVGYFLYEIINIENHMYMKNQKILFVIDLAIDKSQKRKGYGTVLYKYIEDMAKDQNCLKIELNVWDRNIEAKDFYIKMGMRKKYSTMVKEF